MKALKDLNKEKRIYERILHKFDENLMVFDHTEMEMINSSSGEAFQDNFDLLELDPPDIHFVQMSIIRRITWLKHVIKHYNFYTLLENNGKPFPESSVKPDGTDITYQNAHMKTFSKDNEEVRYYEKKSEKYHFPYKCGVPCTETDTGNSTPYSYEIEGEKNNE